MEHKSKPSSVVDATIAFFEKNNNPQFSIGSNAFRWCIAASEILDKINVSVTFPDKIKILFMSNDEILLNSNISTLSTEMNRAFDFITGKTRKDYSNSFLDLSKNGLNENAETFNVAAHDALTQYATVVFKNFQNLKNDAELVKSLQGILDVTTPGHVVFLTLIDPSIPMFDSINEKQAEALGSSLLRNLFRSVDDDKAFAVISRIDALIVV